MNDALPPEQTALEQNESDFRIKATGEIKDSECETAGRLFWYIRYNPDLVQQPKENKMSSRPTDNSSPADYGWGALQRNDLSDQQIGRLYDNRMGM